MRALHAAEREDCPIVVGFEARVTKLLEQERATLAPRHDQPSQRTVRLVPAAELRVEHVTVLPIKHRRARGG